MIRKLGSIDNKMIMSFLVKEPVKNLFIIGDIYNNGYQCAYQEIWGDFSGSGDLRAILLRYYRHYIIAACGEHDVAGFSAICRQDREFINIAGIPENVAAYRETLVLGEPRRFYFARLNRLAGFGENPHSVRLAAAADAGKIAGLLHTIKEFANPADAERIKRAILNGESRYFIVCENGNVTACAATVSENPHSAMVVGVACRDDKRGQGYATACVRKLCETLQPEGKELCLFYDNPDAGRIYQRLGFENIGYWMLVAK